MASKIEDYGMIGNLRTTALISNIGSLDWFCAPRFDSDACFASLLGFDEHGRWSIMPAVAVREYRQCYRGDTLILETDVICDGGAFRRIEFMPLTSSGCEIIRIIEGIEGEVPIEVVMNPRFGYGQYNALISDTKNGYSLIAGPDAIAVRGDVKLHQVEYELQASFTIKKGDRVAFQLSWYPSHLSEPLALDIDKELASATQKWTEWSGRCAYKGKYRDAVMRSLIVLKALTYEPTGGIVAAPTTSLPEELEGVRNWDYRFCWLRDASLTLHALMLGGYIEEATAFRDWLLRAVAGDPDQIQIMYGIDGSRRLTEFSLDTLPGYENSRPVRIGNAASGQFQLDVYGETLNTIFLANKMGMPTRKEGLQIFRAIIDHVSKVWQHPDDGIWEVRGGRRHFTHSKMMAWVAIDRAAKFIAANGTSSEDKAMLSHLLALGERIHEEICQRGFHKGLNAFTQSYGEDTLDASTLLMAHYGFLPATDPRMVGTVKAVENSLLHDGFVLRYDTARTKDGLPGREGAFLACSFWLADNYALSGRTQDAEELFERLLALRNPLGLLSEEYDPVTKRQIGNFPQAFSHLALIGTASILEKQTFADKTSFGAWEKDKFTTVS